jgi:Type I phosphodiesterase / nucleotide pyrophosphatase
VRSSDAAQVDREQPPWLIPEYGRASLAELLPSVLAAIALPGEPNRLGLDPARGTCVFLVDGMGLSFLRSYSDHAPFLGTLLPAARELTAGFPTTTATSLGSLGTGLPPGGHGLLGYQLLVPGDGRLLNLLKWDVPVAPEIWQPRQTIFERAALAGVSTTHVSPEVFRDGGLTRAALRGMRFLAADAPEDLAARAIEALAVPESTLVYTYFGGIDRAGHIDGYGSGEHLGQLAIADQVAAGIARRMPAGTALYITADHGMLAVPADRRIDADRTPELLEGVAALGGEGRARYVYAVDGAAADVLTAWRELLGQRAWVLPRDEAVEAGWFGPVAEWAYPRIGDIVVACRDDWAIVATVRQPKESRLRGMHGSLTEDELAVPLLEFHA